MIGQMVYIHHGGDCEVAKMYNVEPNRLSEQTIKIRSGVHKLTVWSDSKVYF